MAFATPHAEAGLWHTKESALGRGIAYLDMSCVHVRLVG